MSPTAPRTGASQRRDRLGRSLVERGEEETARQLREEVRRLLGHRLARAWRSPATSSTVGARTRNAPLRAAARDRLLGLARGRREASPHRAPGGRPPRRRAARAARRPRRTLGEHRPVGAHAARTPDDRAQTRRAGRAPRARRPRRAVSRKPPFSSGSAPLTRRCVGKIVSPGVVARSPAPPGRSAVSSRPSSSW